MKSQLINLLESFDFPIFLQGSLNPEEPYPDSFFTFWNFDNKDAAFYDDNADRAVGGFWIYFYSTNPRLVESIPEQARQLLKSNDWIIQGKATDVSVDRPTHTGAFFTAYKFEDYETE